MKALFNTSIFYALKNISPNFIQGQPNVENILTYRNKNKPRLKKGKILFRKTMVEGECSDHRICVY